MRVHRGLGSSAHILEVEEQKLLHVCHIGRTIRGNGDEREREGNTVAVGVRKGAQDATGGSCDFFRCWL